MSPMPEQRHWELISALQKFVRRGMELEAGRAFFELAESGHVTWAMNRLMVMAHEDIGLADREAVSMASDSIRQTIEWWKKKDDSWRLSASNAIMALCRAKKSREACHYQAACRWHNEHGDRLEIPDYCLDMHTRRGKAMRRGIEHFLDGGPSTLIPEPAPDHYQDTARKYWAIEYGGKAAQPDDGFGEQAELF